MCVTTAGLKGSASLKARITTTVLILMGRDVDYFGAILSNNGPETQASVMPNCMFQHGRSFARILYFYKKKISHKSRQV